MPHVLVAGRIHDSGLALLDAAADVTYEVVEPINEASYAERIGAADALIIRVQPCTAPTIARAPRLKIVSRHGVGYDAIDVAALSARRIALSIVGDVNAVSVAEHAMMMLLAVAKQAYAADASVRRADWRWRNALPAREVAGKRLLIVGFGRIGRRLAAMGSAFALQIRAYDPELQRAGWPADAPAEPVADLMTGLAWANAVSLHAPKGAAPLLGAAELAAMRPGAILINTARGGVVDEAAMAAALRSGRLAGAGLDVFDQEPPAPDNPLLELPNVLLSPHIAGLTAECAERMAQACARNVVDFFAGRLDPRLVVNARDVFEAPDAALRRREDPDA